MAQHHTKPRHLPANARLGSGAKTHLQWPCKVRLAAARGPRPKSLGCPSRLQGHHQALVPAAMLGEGPLATAILDRDDLLHNQKVILTQPMFGLEEKETQVLSLFLVQIPLCI